MPTSPIAAVHVDADGPDRLAVERRDPQTDSRVVEHGREPAVVLGRLDRGDPTRLQPTASGSLPAREHEVARRSGPAGARTISSGRGAERVPTTRHASSQPNVS